MNISWVFLFIVRQQGTIIFRRDKADLEHKDGLPGMLWNDRNLTSKWDAIMRGVARQQAGTRMMSLPTCITYLMATEARWFLYNNFHTEFSV